MCDGLLRLVDETHVETRGDETHVETKGGGGGGGGRELSLLRSAAELNYYKADRPTYIIIQLSP